MARRDATHGRSHRQRESRQSIVANRPIRAPNAGHRSETSRRDLAAGRVAPWASSRAWGSLKVGSMAACRPAGRARGLERGRGAPPPNRSKLKGLQASPRIFHCPFGCCCRLRGSSTATEGSFGCCLASDAFATPAVTSAFARCGTAWSLLGDFSSLWPGGSRCGQPAPGKR